MDVWTTAVTINSEADYDDDSCTYIGAEECDCAGNVLDECGVCGGGGIADGDCDCAGNCSRRVWSMWRSRNS